MLALIWNGLVIITSVLEVAEILKFEDEKLSLRSISYVCNLLWLIDSFIRSSKTGRLAAIKAEEMVMKDHMKKMGFGTSNRKLIISDDEEESYFRKEDLAGFRTFVFTFSVTMISLLLLLPLSMVTPILPSKVMESIIDEDSEKWQKNVMTSDDDDDTLHSFERYTIFYLIITKFAAKSVHLMKVTISKYTKKVALKTTRFAIRNPKQFRRRLRKVLTYLRWIKYLAPIIGALNKLKGNAGDLLKKARQASQARRQLKLRQRIWNKMSDEEKLELAAVRVQSAFRSKIARKKQKAVRLLLLDQQLISIIKIQHRVRTKARDAKEKIKRKRKEFSTLNKRRFSLFNSLSKPLSYEEKVKWIQLRDELRLHDKTIQSRNALLRPNTTFSVVWKVLFVFTICLEIVQILLSDTTNKKATGKRSLESILTSMLLPTRECEIIHKPKNGLRKVMENTGSFIQKLVPILNRKPKDAQTSDLVCIPLTTFQQIHILLAQTFIKNFVHFVSIICFLDVFVTFFTGEINPNNGVLEPKPFFVRWILPGIILQILVNPAMKDVSSALRMLADFVNSVGPGRFVRWIIIFLPAMLYMGSKIVTLAQLFVRSQNYQLMIRK